MAASALQTLFLGILLLAVRRLLAALLSVGLAPSGTLLLPFLVLRVARLLLLPVLLPLGFGLLPFVARLLLRVLAVVGLACGRSLRLLPFAVCSGLLCALVALLALLLVLVEAR